MKEIQELIKEIIADMRRGAIPKHRKDRDLLSNFADRIEKAVANCNQLKMREALLMVKRLFDGKIMFQHTIRKAHEAVNDALAAPPLYATEDEAYQAYRKEMEGTPEDKQVFFESWLFNKLKGV